MRNPYDWFPTRSKHRRPASKTPTWQNQNVCLLACSTCEVAHVQASDSVCMLASLLARTRSLPRCNCPGEEGESGQVGPCRPPQEGPDQSGRFHAPSRPGWWWLGPWAHLTCKLHRAEVGSQLRPSQQCSCSCGLLSVWCVEGLRPRSSCGVHGSQVRRGWGGMSAAWARPGVERAP
jgi:hypothetical protein